MKRLVAILAICLSAVFLHAESIFDLLLEPDLDASTLERFIIENNVDVNQPSERNEPPLFFYSYHGSDIDVLRTMLRHGADINYRDSKGNNVLENAAHWNTNADMLRYLVDLGLDVNDTNDSGMTTLHHTMYNPQGFTVDGGSEYVRTEEQQLAFIETLIELGADVNAVDNSQATPLMAANASHYPRVYQVLIDHGAKINATDDMNRPVLMYAVTLGDVQLENAMVLVEAGADLNVVDVG